MRINLTLHQVTAFLRLAELSSFSEAAMALGVSQPSLSRTIKSAETILGGPLFFRDTRNLQLTPLGTEFRPIARRLVAEFDSAFGELAQFIEGREGRIVIAALPSVAAVLLPRAIARFRRTSPNVEIVIRDRLSASVIEAVTEGVADIGVTMQPAPAAKLAYRPLLADEFVLVCRSDSRIARGRPASWSVFTQHPFVAMSPASSVRAMTDAAFMQAGIAVQQLYECAHLATTGNLVTAGLGITALPRLTLPVLNMAELSARSLIEPVMVRSLGTVTRAGRPLTPASQAFLTALNQEAAAARGG
ncbi:MAG: LysR family transcriptional regulator [Acidisphaera sp.]|nr:LysR family transcriptional regulator [Acidisphaera sp.]